MTSKMRQALESFDNEVRKLKKVYSEEYQQDQNHVSILIGDSNAISIMPKSETGEYLYYFK